MSESQNPIRCECPIARHEHGTTSMYDRPHRCRCEPCRTAKSEYTQRSRPASPLVNAAPVRERLHLLHGAGLSTREVARMAGLSPATLYAVDSPTRSKRLARVNETTAAAVFAVGYRDAAAVKRTEHSRVDPEVPRNQLQALHAMGWTNEDVVTHSGLRLDTLYRLLRGYTTTVAVARDLDAAYREMREQAPPNGTPLEQARVRRALRRAEQNGWDVFMAA